MGTSNSVNQTTTGITGYTGTAWTGTAVTNHGIVLGGSTSSTLGNVGPTATAGQYLQSAGSSADPTFSTATLPSVATGTGTLLRADGTNWVATTSTYPNTNALNTLLYASSANVMSALPTATNGVLITDGTTGIPSISSTLPTAVQGNITSVGTITSGTWAGTTITVNHGGTGQVTLTNHGVLVGAGTTAISQLAAGTAGQVLQSGGASADPAYSTATYPATSGTSGTILRSNGTNIVNTTATFADTYTASNLLYSNGASTVTGLATANSGVLATSSSGVPSIDTTNFAVLTTGVQLKGNNANTAPPAGFIGELQSSNIAIASGVTITNTAAKTVTSITPGAGTYLLFGTVSFTGISTGTAIYASINTTTDAIGTGAVNYTRLQYAYNGDQDYIAPSQVVTTGGSTTYYLVARADFTVSSSPKAFGKLNILRVG